MSGRLAISLVAALGVAALAAPVAMRPSPLWLWNASASAPIGLYRLRPVGALQLGDWVALRPPAALAPMFASRRYLPLGVPLVKRVAALAPAQICRWGRRITIDGQPAAIARDVDRAGRQLPVWRGCWRLASDAVFVLNATPDSLDGRYFGPVARAAVIGGLTPIWIVAGAAQ
jgi:conjugative transfer signal peptidase TraF